MSNTKSNGGYPLSSSQLTMGKVTVPNRVVFPAWQVNYANTDGTVSQKLMDFYSRLAKGGSGLIFTGAAAVSSDGIPFDRVMRIDNDNQIPSMENLFNLIKSAGAVPGIQLVHYGRQSSTSISGDVLMAPSAIPCPVMSQFDPEYKVKEMTLEEIESMREYFITAAERAAMAGVQVVQIHAAHGYFLGQFMSPYSNKRKDDYGGSVENRCRLILEIIEGTRAKLKDDIAVCVRVNGDDYVEGGLKPIDYKEIVPLLEKAGVEMIDVSFGVYESMQWIVPPKDQGLAPNVDKVAKVKEYANVPVCGVGSVLNMEIAESILKAGKMDLTAMGRAQVADPEIAKKSFEGRESEIRKCLHCNSCTFWTTGDPEMYCAVNPDYKKPK